MPEGKEALPSPRSSLALHSGEEEGWGVPHFSPPLPGPILGGVSEALRAQPAALPPSHFSLKTPGGLEEGERENSEWFRFLGLLLFNPESPPFDSISPRFKTRATSPVSQGSRDEHGPRRPGLGRDGWAPPGAGDVHAKGFCDLWGWWGRVGSRWVGREATDITSFRSETLRISFQFELPSTTSLTAGFRAIPLSQVPRVYRSSFLFFF